MPEGPVAPSPPVPEPPALVPRRSRDGSFSLYSAQFGEGFHCADGALAEARRVFVAPAQLERFAAGSRLRVVEVAVGTGTNTAALVQACQERGLELDWWGLELDARPLQLALADDGFRRQWPAPVLAELENLCSGERLLWGDGRARLSELPDRLAGRCELVLHDGFSPRHCPQLWSQEFLGDLAGLLAPRGRLLTYCSAAAVRRALGLAGLQLAAIRGSGPALAQAAAEDRAMDRAAGPVQAIWSAGTAASPSALPPEAPLRPLTPMELEHLACRAGEPYRDPGRNATAAAILERRQQQQRLSTAEPSGQWQRRWGLARRHGVPPQTDPDRKPAVPAAADPGPGGQGAGGLDLDGPEPADRAR
ncbi:MAG: MnmC family methyltransferase [Synechococcaceae cyanobacterium ELA739]